MTRVKLRLSLLALRYQGWQWRSSQVAMGFTSQRLEFIPSSTIPGMNNLNSLLNQLEQERRTISAQLERLDAALSALGSGNRSGRGQRRISAAGRARIAAAQRARWAKARRQNVVPINSPRRRKMSAAAIGRIRAAQKARWATWRKQQKTA